jgi:3-hydroxybutyryl-CoA dehydrogenase
MLDNTETYGPGISRVGIVGAGTAGAHIALRCAQCGMHTYLFDISPEALRRAMETSVERLDQAVQEGALARNAVPPILSRLHRCDRLEQCVGDAELVIEAVPENLELKRQVFADIDRLAPSSALLATSSSCLPCSRVADATGRAEKVLNLHFPIPPNDGAPLEVMGNPHTGPETLARGEEFVRSLGLLPIRVKREIMGFGLNTIWHEIKKVSLQMVAGGYVDFEDVDRWWIAGTGMTVGLFAAMDKIGLDTVRNIETLYYEESGDERDKPTGFLDKMISLGRLGVKNGRGFYTYPDPQYERPGWLQKELPWTTDMTITLENLVS